VSVASLVPLADGHRQSISAASTLREARPGGREQGLVRASLPRKEEVDG